jgi:sugar phosphate isomerase/epimerase
VLGEKVNAAGMKFGYHNHILEFKETDGVIPYVELLRLTDPSKVTMELDCEWVIVGGGKPIEYLCNYPIRNHDAACEGLQRAVNPPSKTNRPAVAELGQGTIDYTPILEEAAKAGHVKHCLRRARGLQCALDQSLKIDADYLRQLCLS